MIAQLSNHLDLLGKFIEFIDKLKVFTDLSSTSIGKRYTRADELGIPYTITIDFDTVKDLTVTIRNIKDMSQQRYLIDEAIQLIKSNLSV
jgi:glycyl-tRNA synthetase (class II)